MAIIATETLKAFDRALTVDQGNAFRMWLGRVIPHIGDAYRQDTEPFRSHMGASGIGDDCARAIWYSFRWTTRKQFDGRMLRLFNRGHLEEARFIALLLMIGCEVFQQDADGKQFRISDAGGHYGGSGDGVFVGCPDLPPGTPALSEFKTHNEKSFKKLKEEGVRAAKFMHYVQMQQYMRKMSLGVGVYFAVNKNDDEIYAEVVHLDVENADKFLHRAIQIVPLHEPPKRVSESAGWFGCKFCDHRPVCHMSAPPQKNCRTCEWSEPRPDGTWYCNSKDRQMTMLFGPSPDVSNEGETFHLTKARQLEGCKYWEKNSAAFK